MRDLLYELRELYNLPLFQFTTTEFVFVGTSVLGFMSAWEFYKTRNGWLRILMIWLFATMGVTYGMAAINFALVFFELPALDPYTLRMAFGLPKEVIMLLLVWYLKHYNKKAA